MIWDTSSDQSNSTNTHTHIANFNKSTPTKWLKLPHLNHQAHFQFLKPQFEIDIHLQLKSTRSHVFDWGIIFETREREREHFMFAAMHNWSEFSPLQNHFPFPFLFQVHEVVAVFFSTQKDCLTILNPYNHSDWFFILVELTHPPVAEFSISPIFFSVIKSTLQASKHLTSCVLYVLFFYKTHTDKKKFK